MARHYLDHASTSPVRPQVRESMHQALDEFCGDPGRIHHEGMSTRVAVENARDEVAVLLGARSREVVFTSGATESIAMATWGAAERGDHQVFAAVEHSAVRQSAERSGRVTVVGVDGFGRIDADELVAAIEPSTALVHVQWMNHEVGTVQPVADVVAACRRRNILVHVDTAQAAGRTSVDFASLGADFLSVSAHKMGGPPGIGALLVRRGVRVRQLLVGGEQERARRAGLENVPAIVGFGALAVALADTLDSEISESHRQSSAIAAAATEVDGVRRYGHEVERAPHLVCLGIDGIEPQAVLLDLDRRGIAVHSGSACASEGLEPSPVLEAMGVDAHRSLRVSVGWNTTDTDVDAFCAAFPEVVARLRAYHL